MLIGKFTLSVSIVSYTLCVKSGYDLLVRRGVPHLLMISVLIVISISIFPVGVWWVPIVLYGVFTSA